MKIGVISDTHDFLDPKIPELFKGVDHILHGGDIGMPALLLELEMIAPVTAVGGNTDDPSFHYPLTKTVELGGGKFFLHHIVDPRSLREDLKLQINRARPEVVVFGHTHRQFGERVNGILFLNPGYAGRPKSGAARGAAILHLNSKELRHEFLSL